MIDSHYRFYVLPHMDADKKAYPMFSSRGPERLAYFPIVDNGIWVVNRLNNSAVLYRALLEAMDHQNWLQGNPQEVTGNLIWAMNKFRDNLSE